MWVGVWFSEGGQKINAMQPVKINSLSWADIESEVKALYAKAKLVSQSSASEHWMLFHVKTLVPVRQKGLIIQQNRLVRLLISVTEVGE